MTPLNATWHKALTRSTIAAFTFAALCLPPAVPASSAQTKSPGDMMRIRTMTPADIMTKVRRHQTTPITQKLGAGEVGTINAQEVKCFKKRAGKAVQVRCPDLIVVETR